MSLFVQIVHMIIQLITYGCLPSDYIDNTFSIQFSGRCISLCVYSLGVYIRPWYSLIVRMLEEKFWYQSKIYFVLIWNLSQLVRQKIELKTSILGKRIWSWWFPVLLSVAHGNLKKSFISQVRLNRSRNPEFY